MDTRELNQQTEINKIQNSIQDLSEDQQILEINSLKLNTQFKNAMIFNLVTKMDTKSVMDKVYLNELEHIESFPTELKYYIHFPYLLHGAVVVLFYLRYKKSNQFSQYLFIINVILCNILELNPASTLGVLCATSLLNEFGKYKRIQTCNQQNWVNYTEASSNYTYLMNRQVNGGGVRFKDVVKYFFKIDIDASYQRIKHLFFDDLLNDDVITSQFF